MKPSETAPIAPPTRCTPTTSSESSNPALYFRPTAYEQPAPATKPSTIAAHGSMKPQAGVTATSPATAPEAMPSEVGAPSLNFSTRIQAPAATAGAIWVFMKASALVPSTPISEPALNPNQPNHRIAAPSSTN